MSRHIVSLLVPARSLYLLWPIALPSPGLHFVYTHTSHHPSRGPSSRGTLKLPPTGNATRLPLPRHIVSLTAPVASLYPLWPIALPLSGKRFVYIHPSRQHFPGPAARGTLKFTCARRVPDSVCLWLRCVIPVGGFPSGRAKWGPQWDGRPRRWDVSGGRGCIARGKQQNTEPAHGGPPLCDASPPAGRRWNVPPAGIYTRTTRTRAAGGLPCGGLPRAMGSKELAQNHAPPPRALAKMGRIAPRHRSRRWPNEVSSPGSVAQWGGRWT